MRKSIILRLSPAEAAHHEDILQAIANSESLSPKAISGFHLLKRSIDARGKAIYINLQVMAFINEPFHTESPVAFTFPDVTHAKKTVVIIGAGPAGLFAALKLIESGIKPVLLERGKDVRNRRRDLAILNKEGIIHPDSNYCFGEGGAGTYSDGKLYTRSNKRGDINRILNLFVHFGAPEQIKTEAHPHIGTNKLPQIITAMRACILECGGEVHFEKKVSGLQIENDLIKAVYCADKDVFHADDFILATGHSSRDIFEMLQNHQLDIEAKPFALGVRVEHPQHIIDRIQYHCESRSEWLPPAAYSLVQQVEERGVFSFCMCPGGIIAPASTSPGELVVNGWSPSKRNNPFANSGMVVQVEKDEVLRYMKESNKEDALLFMRFQQHVEQKAFAAGGGKFVAPAQRMTDFCNNKISSTLPNNSYLPGLQSADLRTVLPDFIQNRLAAAFRIFGKKMKGYFTEDAHVVATESRTSSPVRIPRHQETLHHPQLRNLYPCGEGAGYAGGIVSAAMDGERVAAVIGEK
jgi:uncharacterized FAD-dependent dehydrogenase